MTRALVSSARDAGIRVVENDLTADAALIWSVLWAGRMAGNRQVYEHYRAQNKPVIAVDVGCLHRGRTWKIAVNNINALGYYGHQINLDPDRPRRLGVILGINVNRHGSILIAAQHHRSLQLQGLPKQEQWVTEVVRQLRQHTDRPIVIRSHPRSPLDTAALPQDCQHQVPCHLDGTYDDYDIDYGHHAVVNYCSGPGIQAALYGTRPLVHPHSLAFPVGIDFNDIEQPYVRDREQWLIEIAHTEYLLEEIQQGVWLKRLNDVLL